MFVSCHFYILKPTNLCKCIVLQFLHGFYSNFAILEVCDVSNFFFHFSNSKVELKDCYKFVCLFKKLKVEGSCSYS